MRGSRDRIITSHVGSLPRPENLIEANRLRDQNPAADEKRFQDLLQQSVSDIVRKQKDLGIDVPNDGEFGKSMGSRVNYRAWLSYSFYRLAGLAFDQTVSAPPRPARPGELVIARFDQRRDRTKFAAAYADPEFGISMGPAYARPVCVGPVSYCGHDAIKADIARFKVALAAGGLDEGFMSAIGPGSASRLGNVYYKSDDEFMFACAEAMREEYKAIVDAGLVLQIDDPAIAESWDQIVPEPSVADYRKFTMMRVEALNHALRGLPRDRIRFHLCWGSWHGPHVTDLPMRDVIDAMLAINCQAYSFEAGNVRHEHEWSIWREAKLPDDKLILPGVVSHATNVVEHPDLVAERIVRFANVVGRERVIASTDCGLGGRIHPDIAWAKLESLAEGSLRASKQLWC